MEMQSLERLGKDIEDGVRSHTTLTQWNHIRRTKGHIQTREQQNYQNENSTQLIYTMDDAHTLVDKKNYLNLLCHVMLALICYNHAASICGRKIETPIRYKYLHSFFAFYVAQHL